ncbi:pyrimidine 5'-nucleotidase [Rheinheimera sp. NSM]|uniref:pyrimidine 5'-nucleotidase n=1 Tax=Rheinheimera sp. NSM TaxID=3457884 RepID=UPI0040360BD2
MRYQWILFDADETLFHFDAFAGLQLMFSRHDYAFDSTEYDYYQSINLPLWQQYQQGEISAKQLQVNRFTPWAAKLNTSAAALNSAFMLAMADICTPLPGATELITALKGRVNMGIITNGFTELQQIRLERTGFADVFSPLVISEQVGVAKPHIDIFNHAFALMEHPPKQQILMVGDNPHADIRGGINAGIDTCWLNRHATARPQDITPHYEVSSLQQLQQWLLS